MDQNGLCQDCDELPESVQCAKCENRDVCLECGAGFRLTSDGTCKQCTLDKCANCDALTGHCLECKKGFYLDDVTHECEPCVAPCMDCANRDFCKECNSQVHHLVVPEDGNCVCDAYRGWSPSKIDASGADLWKCMCTREFMSIDGECTSCDAAFPGCNACGRVGDLSFVSPVGIRVEANPDYVPPIIEELNQDEGDTKT